MLMTEIKRFQMQHSRNAADTIEAALDYALRTHCIVELQDADYPDLVLLIDEKSDITNLQTTYRVLRLKYRSSIKGDVNRVSSFNITK